MSKLKEFISKHSGIFNIQFGVLAALLVLCIVLLATSRENGDDDGVVQVDPVPPIGDLNDDPKPPDFIHTDVEVTESNIFEFITLGQYKGLAIDKTNVGQQEIEEFINQHLLESAKYTEIHDRAVQNGDVVIIDYAGSVDGVPFAGGTDHGVDLEIGSNSFIPGFEEQIIGHSVGEQFDIFVKFPDTYHAPDLAGQEAVFEINLISIYALQPPELDFEFISSLGLGSVEEYREIVKERLERQARESEWIQIIEDIIENSIFHKIPNSEIDQHISLSLIWLGYEAASNGLDIEEFVYYATYGMSLEEFTEDNLRPNAVNSVREDLLIRAIAVTEGITVTDAEIDEEVLKIVDEFFFESVEVFMDIYTRVNVTVALLRDKLFDFLIDSAVQK